ncbi:MAG: quinolinate synthase NadA, partial [Bacteroidales bacterium]|nr:quinolinate synthase NadA [Bacteroidales bacterium]
MQNEDYISAINRMRQEKNAIILAHYYQTSDIQDIADFVGDSLALSQKAVYNEADIILFAGVKFMAETAKILSPQKKVLLPDMDAGCSLADSCSAGDLKKFISENPGRTLIAYINSTTEVKAMADIICTSTNVVQVIESLPEEEKIIFVPDRNMGSYVREKTGRDIIVWDGACHVHENFSPEAILKLRNEYPEAKILVHPECEYPVRQLADFIGSTAGMLEYAGKDKNKAY